MDLKVEVKAILASLVEHHTAIRACVAHLRIVDSQLAPSHQHL